jgi:hypothetical protein
VLVLGNYGQPNIDSKSYIDSLNERMQGFAARRLQAVRPGSCFKALKRSWPLAPTACLVALGVTVLALANGPVRGGENWSRVAVTSLVGLAERNNAYQMYKFGFPWHGPLGFAVLAIIGAILAACKSHIGG